MNKSASSNRMPTLLYNSENMYRESDIKMSDENDDREKNGKLLERLVNRFSPEKVSSMMTLLH